MGANFGAERLGVVPDIITMAKGLTNAAVPMGAVAVRNGVYDAIVHGAPGGDRAVPRLHLFRPPAGLGRRHRVAWTCSARRTCRAASLAIEPYWQKAVHALRGLPNVIDIRHTPGWLPGSSCSPGPASRRDRAMQVFGRCFDAGLLVRTTGDTVALSPPLIIETAHVDRIVETLTEAIRAEAA